MDDDTRMALAGLALCDALDDGAVDAEARIKAVATARKHYHAVLSRYKDNPAAPVKPRCVCPEEASGPCACVDECMCAEA